MTLDEARQHIGDGVVYDPYAPELDEPEEGVITSVNDHYVFVRYGADKGSKATAADRLTLLAEESCEFRCGYVSSGQDLLNHMFWEHQASCAECAAKAPDPQWQSLNHEPDCPRLQPGYVYPEATPAVAGQEE